MNPINRAYRLKLSILFFERFSNTVIFGMYVNYLFKQAKHKGISDVEIPQKWVFIDFILLCNDRKVARP